MSGLSRKLFCGMAVFSGLVCSTVNAQVSTDPTQYPEEFIQGINKASAMTKVDMVEAIRINLQLYVKYPGPVIDYNLGHSYELLGSCKNAIQFYYKIKSYHLPYDDPVFAQALEKFDEIAFCESWQTFRLKCDMPEGSTIFLDNIPIKSCWPRPISLQDGEHVIKLVSADGEREVVREIQAESGQPEEIIDLSFDVDTDESID